MTKLPNLENPLLLRTDFADDAAWAAVCEAVQAKSEQGFQAQVECVSDPAFDGLTVDQLMTLITEPADDDWGFVFLVDRLTLTHLESLVLVVDLDEHEQPGRTFRVIPAEMWAVENNLSIANMDFEDFADAVDEDGVFRGFPEG